MKFHTLTHAAAHLAAACAFVLLTFGAGARAQQTPPADPTQQDSFNRRDLRDREAALRTRAAAEVKPAYEPNPALRLEQIKDDYGRIQMLNNELRRAAHSAAAPDYKRIASAAADVRKRASRLRANLAFPEPDEEADAREDSDKDPDATRKDAEASDDDARVKTFLTSLDESVVSFVNNPVFRSSALDAPQAARASRDLARIIELSAEIRKAAERLARARGKSK